MKREHHQFDPPPPAQSSSSGKGKMWEEEHSRQPDGVMDELLAVLGYKVKSSDMAEVALKLEQLEEVMGAAAQEDGFSCLSSYTIHYDPSNLSTWLESMISGFNPGTGLDPLPPAAAAVPPPPPPPFDDSSFVAPAESSTITSIDFPSCSSEYDLKAIPGKAMYSSNTHQVQIQTQSPTHFDSSSSSINSSARENKRLKTSPTDQIYQTVESTRPIILADSQENGIRLVHGLMACAEAVQLNNLNLAEAFVKQIRLLALSQAGAMGKVATFFAEALARRIYGFCPQNSIDHSFSDLLEMQFYETSPYLKFAHFTANQAILEAFEGKNGVHAIDFSMNQGMQWPALMQALALRPGGPPAFRLTGIGLMASDNMDHLQQVGWKLAQLAETIHVKFEYRGFVVNSPADLDLSMLELPSEVDAVAVNSVFELHKVLARPGAMEKVLSVVTNIKPDIFTVVEQEANHNGPVFLDRFTESLHYYSTMFDSLEGSVNSPDKAMSEAYLGKQICNLVACEGVDRVERHESLTQWRTLFSSVGFVPAHLGSNAFMQASMLLALFAGGEGYKVEENNGCLTLGWYTRPLIATSAWKLASKLVVRH